MFLQILLQVLQSRGGKKMNTDERRLIEESKRKDIVENINLNMFVEAGAGAGKTSLIVDRITNQLRKGVLNPDEIVVITFTNKAAEELYGRILKAVREAVSKDPENKNLIKALKNIDLMTISTIHSFCRKMLMERAFDAHIRLNAELLDNDENELVQKKLFEKWYVNISNKDISDIIKMFGRKDTVKNSIYETYKNICELSENTALMYRKDLLNNSCEHYEKRACELFNAFKNKIREIICDELNDNSISDISEYTKGDLKKLLIEDTGDYKSVLNKIEKYKNLEKCRGELFNKQKKVIKNISNNLPIMEERVAQWISENVAEFNKEYKLYVNAKIVSLAEKATKEISTTEGGKYLNNDLLLKKARELVCKNEKAREYFSNKCKCIYVDEFQDTDHIQVDIIWALAEKEYGSNILKDGGLFIVGDPKQSIYRFRGADTDIFYTIKKKMSECENAEVYELSFNYRSNSNIINWINEKFKEPDKFGENYEDMITINDEILEGKDLERVINKVYCYGENDKPVKSDKDKNDLYNVISKLTSAENNYKIMDIDKNHKRFLRNIKYSDFLVLTSAAEGTYDYAKFLLENGIPVDYSGKIYMKDFIEIHNFVSLFEFLVERKNTKARIGAIHALLGQENISNSENAEKRLDMLTKATENMNSYSIARYLADHIDILLPWGENISCNEVIMIQTKLQQMIENIFSSGYDDNFNLAKKFKNYFGATKERDLSLEENRNAVRFMNIHKAKGLEGNIVIIAKRNSELYKYSTDFTDKKDGKRYYYPSVLMNSEINKKSDNACRLDSLRLQYVAATRAREALIIMDAAVNTKCKKRYFDDFEVNALPSISEIIKNDSVNEEEKEYKDYTSVLEGINQKPINEEQKIPLYYCIRPSDLEQHATNYENSDELKNNDVNITVEVDDRPKGNIAGNVLHRAYELFVNRWKNKDFCKDNINLINLCAVQAVIENSSDIYESEREKYKNFAADTINKFVNDKKMVELLKNAKEIYTELEFSYFTDRKKDMNMFENISKLENRDKVWVNGTADLVVVNNDNSVVIADYKSDMNTKGIKDFKSELNKRYGEQLKLYKYSINKLLEVDMGKIETIIVNYEE